MIVERASKWRSTTKRLAYPSLVRMEGDFCIRTDRPLTAIIRCASML